MATREQMIAKRDEIVNAYIAGGMDYDQARFKVMTVGASGLGILIDQPEEELTPELEELRQMLQSMPKPEAVDYSSPTLPDYSRDTAVDGIE